MEVKIAKMLKWPVLYNSLGPCFFASAFGPPTVSHCKRISSKPV
jgi:hypothetical protein